MNNHSAVEVVGDDIMEIIKAKCKRDKIAFSWRYDDSDFEIMEILKDKKAVVLLNKSDLASVTSKEDEIGRAHV